MSVLIGTPRVSVVIPTYNRAADLRRCLRSLAAQTMKDFEVIVCDDGSTDDSAVVVSEFGDRLDVTYDWAENWGGPARPRNRGIAMARGEFIAFLDSDDWWSPEKLARSLPPLEAGADVVYHDLYRVHDATRGAGRQRVRSWSVQPPVYRNLVEMGNAIPLSSAVARTTLLRRAGGMPEERELIAMEDYECWLTVAGLTERFVRIPGSFGCYWEGGGNTSSDARTLRLLEVFVQRRARRTEWQVAPAWLAYTRARIHYRARNFDAARDELATIGARRAPWSIRLKALATRVAMWLPSEMVRSA